MQRNVPTRLIREGIISSDIVDLLDAPAEVFYRRLLNKVDDYGLYDARPSILRANLYPLRVDRVREADISRWMAACQKAGLIVLYQAEGKSCLQMLDTNWQKRSEPKYPLPPVNGCKQLETPVHLGVVVVEDVVEVGAQPHDPVEKPSSGTSDPEKKHSFRESQYFDPFRLQEKLSDWPEERVQEYHERMLSASDASHLVYFDWSAVAIQWYLRDQKPRKRK